MKQIFPRARDLGFRGIVHDTEDYVGHWFVDTAEYVRRVHDAYPFATRVLPGYRPWNMNHRLPNYLPKYLGEQLRRTRNLALGCWIYTESIPHGGDPRGHLDPATLETYGIDPQAYIDVLRQHPTSRTATLELAK
jgi:hypothetical protein